MRVSRIGAGERFQPVDHEGVGPIRLQGGRATPTDGLTVVLSHYLPGATAKLAPQAVETVCLVVAGEIVFASDGQEHSVGPFDSVHFTPGTLRSVENRTNLPASVLVIRAVTPARTS